MTKQIAPGAGKYNPVSAMAQNPVAANLLMLLMVLAGFFYMQNIRQEIQPNYTYASVIVEMSYPSASPEQVEQNIILAIEASLKSIEGVARISSTASEGKASVYVDISDGENLDRVLQNIRNAVDGIASFPSDAERPSVRLDDDARWLTTIGISGAVSEKVIFDLVNRIKSELLEKEGIIQVLTRVAKEPEISIEIPQARLREIKLTLEQVAQKISLAAKDVPSGSLKTKAGQYVLRTEGRREQGFNFNNIALKTADNGSVVTLGDLATVRDGFKQNHSYFSYNGAAGVILYVYQSKNSRTLDLAAQVQQYVNGLSAQLPDTVKLDFPYQRVARYQDRIAMLVENGVTGLLLVILVLGIFVNARLAFWVAVSIPVVFISSFTILHYLDVSLNMISMFAFIMTLGIVVDDAIIVGESIYQKKQQGLPTNQAVIEGANAMLMPVLFAVATNIIAFIPLLMMPGNMGQYMRSLPLVAMVVFMVSLVEALFILPAHLNSKDNVFVLPAFLKPFQRCKLFRDRIAAGFDSFRDTRFVTLLNWSIIHRYTTVVLFSGGLLLVFAWFSSDRIAFRWYPQIPSDQISVRLKMQVGTDIQDTVLLSKRIEAAGLEALLALGSLADIHSRSISAGITDPLRSTISFDLVTQQNRDFTQDQFVRLWRQKLGKVNQAKSIAFDSLVGFGSGAGLYINLRHSSNKVLESAARELAAKISTIEGLVDISDGLAQGKKQLKYTLSQEAKALGLTEAALGSQLNAAFYGSEALRMLRDRDQVKVFVRLPLAERDSLMDLDNFVIRTDAGIELPLSQAAQIKHSRTFTAIKRENGRRNVRVGALVDPVNGNESLARRTLNNEILPALKAKYPGLETTRTARNGGQSPLQMVLTGLAVVSILIFALMASLFKSYSQGMIVILTIPYCVAAAVAGHVVMGYSLTANSLFAMVALAGMVVNGAWVLTVRMNELLGQGMAYPDAIVNAAISRFRPIVLTAITTTAGLLPMLFETSTQALFLVPFAIALSFGTMTSTLVVLLFIPALHAIYFDLRTKAGLFLQPSIK